MFCVCCYNELVFFFFPSTKCELQVPPGPFGHRWVPPQPPWAFFPSPSPIKVSPLMMTPPDGATFPPRRKTLLGEAAGEGGYYVGFSTYLTSTFGSHIWSLICFTGVQLMRQNGFYQKSPSKPSCCSKTVSTRIEKGTKEYHAQINIYQSKMINK